MRGSHLLEARRETNRVEQTRSRFLYVNIAWCGPPETVDDYEWMKQKETQQEKGDMGSPATVGIAY